MRNKKHFGTMVLTVLLTVALVLPVSAAPDLSGEELHVLMLAGYKLDAVRETVAAFEDATGSRVVLDGLANADLHQKMLIELAAGVSSYDVLMLDEAFVGSLAPFLEPLDPLIERDQFDVEDFYPIVWAAGEWGGQQVALPMDAAVHVLMYQSDLFAEAGVTPPTTWPELMEAAEILTDPENDQYGYSLAGARSTQSAVNLVLFMHAFGGDVFDENWNPIVTSPESIQGLEFFRDLHHNVAPPGSSSYDLYEVTRDLQQGTAAMAHQWVGVSEAVRDPEQSNIADTVAWAVLPSTPQRGVWSLGIPKGSSTKDAAWELMKWMTSPEGGLAYSMGGGGYSPRISVLTDPEFVKEYPYAEVLVDSLKIAGIRPRLAEWGEVNTVLQILASEISSGSLEVAEAAEKASRSLERIVRNAGLLK